jgi:hypothetical protein
VLESLDHAGMGVAEDQRAPGKNVVQIAVAIDIER